MVASIDGATAIDGVSGGLGGTADKEVFRAIRAIADVILVAAGTVRAERYGPPRTSPDLQAARVARGQTPFPRLAIVSGSLDLDEDATLFSEAAEPPLVLTTDDASLERITALGKVAEVRRIGPGPLAPAAVVSALAAVGARVAVCEGGPSLNGQLLAADLIDEVNLSLSPLLVGGSSARVAAGPATAGTRLDLAHLWESEGLLLARYARP